MEEEQQQHLLSIGEERKEQVMLEGEKEESWIQKEEMEDFSQDVLDLGYKNSMSPDSGNCEAILAVTQSPVQ